MNRHVWVVIAVATGAAIVVGFALDLPGFHSIRLRLAGGLTVGDRLAQYGEAARARLAPHFRNANVSYPPDAFVLAAFKREGVLEVYAWNEGEPRSFIRSYPILAASGELGPKLREGDEQVPEGLYRIESLNPNSRFHLALRLNYPNDDDQRQAVANGRSDLGGDIMIHGDSVSIGCLAMGDEAAEDLFILAADSAWRAAEIVIAPIDFRRRELPADMPELPGWIEARYAFLHEKLRGLPVVSR